MEPQTLQAEVRQKGGKGPARQLRTRGLIPAIFYGPKKEPVKLTVNPSALEKAITGAFARNQLLELDFDGKKELAIVKDLTIDPISRRIRHVDLYAVARDRTIVTEVPFETQGRALGVQKGGGMRKLFRTLPVRAFPQDVPSVIMLDVSNLDLAANVKVQDLQLPTGVEVTLSPERRVLFIEAKERKVIEDEDEKPAAAAAT